MNDFPPKLVAVKIAEVKCHSAQEDVRQDNGGIGDKALCGVLAG